MQILDEFVEAVMSRWPKTVLQFEDFQLQYAHTLLQRYKHQHLVFNDDIQVCVCACICMPPSTVHSVFDLLMFNSVTHSNFRKPALWYKLLRLALHAGKASRNS